MTPATRPARRAPVHGFTLIEVMVSILLFSFGVLGIIGLQAKLLQQTTQTGDRARAALLADEMAAQVWQQQTVALNSSTISAWQTRVSSPAVAGLPGGTGSYTVSGNKATIAITWTPTTAASGAVPSSYQTTVVVP